MHSLRWFQVPLCTSNNSIKHQLFAYKQLNGQRDLFLRIRFNVSHLFANILKGQTVLFDLSDATPQGQSWPRSNGNEVVLHIPQSSRITGASQSDLVSYILLSIEMQLVYSTATANKVSSDFKDLESVEYAFIAITLSSTQKYIYQ